MYKYIIIIQGNRPEENKYFNIRVKKKKRKDLCEAIRPRHVSIDQSAGGQKVGTLLGLNKTERSQATRPLTYYKSWWPDKQDNHLNQRKIDPPSHTHPPIENKNKKWGQILHKQETKL